MTKDPWESEECQDQKERLASQVRMVVKEYLGCPAPRVFQEKVGLQVMLVLKDFLVYLDHMAKKDTWV